MGRMDGFDPWIDAEDLENEAAVRGLVSALEESEYEELTEEIWGKLSRTYTGKNGNRLKKWVFLRTYLSLCELDEVEANPRILKLLQVKKVRTLSGVTPVTVLTKPFPCPGKCIFCPTDVRMPKSYLADEPGAMRAYRAEFDPFEQVQGRIDTLYANGHSVSKIELLILGGTWSSYRNQYQEEFIRRCLDAMNQQISPNLEAAQKLNEHAIHRNVGLVVETRPDHVTFKELAWMRTLGVTKVQMGLQSMDDEVLALNHRGHTVEESTRALRRLRRAGFKIVLHWMPNLLGSTPQKDLEDFKRIWNHPDVQPDELKIYPCSLLKNAELYQYWQRGEWEAYSDEDLIELTAECKALVKPYCRINRVFRDIHPHHIVTGMNRLNFRQMVKKHMAQKQTECHCIRCKEVKGKIDDLNQLTLNPYRYETSISTEYFLNYQTQNEQIAGFLRLSLPYHPDKDVDHLPELQGAALVREVHVYGPALQFGQRQSGTQHRGVGTRLLEDAEHFAHQAGYSKLAIIASVGTRDYYRKRGFELQGTYMVKSW